jgi:hypothetical protein
MLELHNSALAANRDHKPFIVIVKSAFWLSEQRL